MPPSIRLRRSQSRVLARTPSNEPADPQSPTVEPASAVSERPLNSMPGTANSQRTRPRSRTVASVFSTSSTGGPSYLRTVTSGQDLTRLSPPHSSRTYQPLSDAGPNSGLAPPLSAVSGTAQSSYFLSSTPGIAQARFGDSPSDIPEQPSQQPSLHRAPSSATADLSPLAAQFRSRHGSASSFQTPIDLRFSPGQKGVLDEVVRRESLERELTDVDVPDSTRREIRASFDKSSPRPAASENEPVRQLEMEMEEEEEEHHYDEVVDHLDVIDPGVSTISHLANAANTILIPPFFSSTRKPVVNLPEISLLPTTSDEQLLIPSAHEATNGEKGFTIARVPDKGGKDGGVPPFDELDQHVQNVLSKRQKARRALKGLWAFLKTPMGIFAAVYGFLCAFWGAAIVLFLVHWINLHNDYEQKLWIEISCQIENGLFTITGIGLIPWRTIDTYRIIRIAHYKNISRKLRNKQGMPALPDENDLPDPERGILPGETTLLTEAQQTALSYQQDKFMKSQTWYRAHETDTHRAFPIQTALWICLLIDGNSLFQCMLSATMWGLNMWNRPAWSTGILVPASFLCGIAAAIMIWRGGQNTKKVEEVESKLRDALGVPEDEESGRRRSASLKRVISGRSGRSVVNGGIEKEEAKETAEGILEPGSSKRTS